MSFLDQIIEEREFNVEMEQYEEELSQLEEQYNELYAKVQNLNEDAMDFGDKTDIGEIFDEAQKRMKTAKWAFGLTNKLKSPEDRQKHRRNIIIVMNKLRALINRLVKQLTVEVKKDSGQQQGQQRRPQPQRPSGEGRYGNMDAGMNQRPGMAT